MKTLVSEGKTNEDTGNGSKKKQKQGSQSSKKYQKNFNYITYFNKIRMGIMQIVIASLQSQKTSSSLDVFRVNGCCHKSFAKNILYLIHSPVFKSSENLYSTWF